MTSGSVPARVSLGAVLEQGRAAWCSRKARHRSAVRVVGRRIVACGAALELPSAVRKMVWFQGGTSQAAQRPSFLRRLGVPTRGAESTVSQEFDWNEAGDDLIVPSTQAVAVYLNPAGDIVIRQERHWNE
jgi:hypothetical protein